MMFFGGKGRGRGSRSVINWVQEDAVLQDASFYCPIELQGSSVSFNPAWHAGGRYMMRLLQLSFQPEKSYNLQIECIVVHDPINMNIVRGVLGSFCIGIILLLALNTSMNPFWGFVLLILGRYSRGFAVGAGAGAKACGVNVREWSSSVQGYPVWESHGENWLFWNGVIQI